MTRLCILLSVVFLLTGCATALSSIEKQGDVYYVTHLTQGFLGNLSGKLLVCKAQGKTAMRCNVVGEP
ncbi:MAG: hypothetical protein JRI68_15390 [Deltaproteobacteria bacterium]|nr:hypothetical protein [Deltaproteobacteria bacterium]